MRSGPFPNLNCRIQQCSIYKCCSSDQGKFTVCVSTNTDFISLNVDNSTECPSDGKSVISITLSWGNTEWQFIGSHLRVFLSTAREAIYFVRGTNWSRITSSVFPNNIVARAVIYTEHVCVSYANFTLVVNPVSSHGD
jgi:hypothetical protein